MPPGPPQGPPSGGSPVPPYGPPPGMPPGGDPGRPYAPVAGLHLRQKITLMANQYWVYSIDSNGTAGPMVAFAAQKRMKLREEVRFFADEQQTRLLFWFKSRQVIDMAATTDIFDNMGNPIGVFRKDAVKSLVNSTWYLEADGVSATGRERSQGVAVARRFAGMLPGVLGDLADMVPWQFHFDFVDASGNQVMAVERLLALRDTYQIWTPPSADGRPLDWRVAAALGVALDAFQGR